MYLFPQLYDIFLIVLMKLLLIWENMLTIIHPTPPPKKNQQPNNW